ncbi:MFS transporter [Singulisphaera sp. PoT]|uniref:MFS transporter n=1 Tax=Singulisphaera sp. PoT TaxID=3411797 RepID=UPI003BF585D0
MSERIATERPSYLPRMFSALDNPSYRRFYIGQGISLVGAWIQAAAVSWIVFQDTNSELWLGIVAAASVLPGLLVGVFSGALADRVVPRNMILLMEIAQMILAFTLAGLIGSGVADVRLLTLILALTRVCVAFEMPSRQVFMYQLVGREELTNAIALNSGLFNASRVIGPALAGILLARFDETVCFFLNGLSYVAAIMAVLSIPRRVVVEAPAPRTEHRGVLGGFSYAWQDRRVGILFLAMTLFGIIGMGYDAMIPAFAKRVVHTDVGGYGVLLSSSGVGATLGAFAVAWLGGFRRKEKLLVGGLLLFAGSLAAAAALPTLAPMSWPRGARVGLASICLFGIGFGAVVFYSAMQMLIQVSVPDHLRGRVMGIWMIAFSGSVPLGSLWTGKLASSWGLPSTIGLSAVLCVFMAVGLAAWDHRTRHAHP